MKKRILNFELYCFRVDPREEDLFGDSGDDLTGFTPEDADLLQKTGKGGLEDEPGHRGVDDDDPGAEGSGWDTRDPGK